MKHVVRFSLDDMNTVLTALYTAISEKKVLYRKTFDGTEDCNILHARSLLEEQIKMLNSAVEAVHNFKMEV